MLLVRLRPPLEVIREMSDGKGQQTFSDCFCHLNRFHHFHPVSLSTHGIDCLDQRPDVTVAVSKRLQAIRVIGCQWNMIRHQHIGITDLFVDLDGFYEVNVPLIGKNLHKIVAMAADVAEMYVEYLVARTEVANDVVDFYAWILQHLRDRALAEI